MVRDVKEAFDVPVILGGGTNIENAAGRLKYADGVIVGTCFEKGVQVLTNDIGLNGKGVRYAD